MHDEAPTIWLENGAVLVRQCPKCGRFVKADETIRCYEMAPVIREENAMCRKCGRVQMELEGFCP